MNKNLIILLIIVIVVVLLVGGGIGVFYKTEKSSSKVESPQAASSIASGLSSGAGGYFNVSGQVTGIEGRNIYIKFRGNSLMVKVEDSAPIYSFIEPAPTKAGQLVIISTQKIAKFEDIKKGDTLNIALKFLADGSINGTSVVILPPLPVLAPTKK
jgi:hypothetical protein